MTIMLQAYKNVFGIYNRVIFIYLPYVAARDRTNHSSETTARLGNYCGRLPHYDFEQLGNYASVPREPHQH